jgi:hypothetical protein
MPKSAEERRRAEEALARDLNETARAMRATIPAPPLTEEQQTALGDYDPAALEGLYDFELQELADVALRIRREVAALSDEELEAEEVRRRGGRASAGRRSGDSPL